MYARARCREGKWEGEPLTEHLLQVAELSAELAKRLAPEELCPGRDAAQDAYVAGLLHDVGKALFQRECEKDGDMLTFPLHELVGAAVARASGYWAIVRPIALHHQGLRLLIKPIKPDILIKQYEANKNLLKNLLSELKSATNIEFRTPKLEQIQLLLDINYGGSYPCGNEKRYRYYQRLLTAVLMIADNYVARKAAEKWCLANEASKYVEDITRFVDTLKHQHEHRPPPASHSNPATCR